MVHKSFEVADEADGVLNAVLQENLSGVRVVRAFGPVSYTHLVFAPLMPSLKPAVIWLLFLRT